MANCVIGDPPVFSEEIVKWDKQTDADGQAMGQVIEQLLNNTVYNKQAAERAKSYVDVTFSAAGWIGETAPYTQSVAAEGLTEEDYSDYQPPVEEPEPQPSQPEIPPEQESSQAGPQHQPQWKSFVWPALGAVVLVFLVLSIFIKRKRGRNP